jgi:hypothetical protein
MQEGYENLRPYWEAWKANNERPSDPTAAGNWDAMREIFKAVAMSSSVEPYRGAIDFILNSRSRWLSQLKSLPTWDDQTKRLKLFRGVSGEQAIRLRKALRDSAAFYEQAAVPISYSIEREVALGFASKGLNDGCVYTVAATEDSVIFSDLDGHYQEGLVDHEKEVVIWHKEAILIRPEHMICSEVRFRKMAQLNRNPASKARREAERKRLEDKEKLL